MKMAWIALLRRTELTEEPISDWLSRKKCLSGNSLARMLPTCIAEVGHHGLRFFHLDHQSMFIFDLLQVDILHIVSAECISYFSHGEILCSFVLEQRATGKIDTHIGMASGDLDKGDKTNNYDIRRTGRT